MNTRLITALNMSSDDRESVTAFLAYVPSKEYSYILNNLQNLLHQNERDYFSGLNYERRKLSYLLGRYAAKLAVSSYLEEASFAEIEIASGIFNQPFVKHQSIDTPDVTISHCDGLAVAIAFCPSQILGVDIEYVARDKISVFQSQLTEQEKHYADNRFKDSALGSVCLWTIKEALSKALKCGFMTPFDILEVELLNNMSDRTYLSFFKNFKQYKCVSVIFGSYVLSVVLPSKTILENLIESLLECFNELSYREHSPIRL
jgi:Phosphopantetheinyl transferase